MTKPLFFSILIFAVLGAFLFLISKPSRAGTQIKTSDPPEEKVKFPINKDDYQRFILVHGGSISIIQNLLIEYGELNFSNEYEIKIVNISKLGDLFVIRINEDLNFYQYHNASHWLIGFGHEALNGTANNVFAVAINTKNNNESYYSYIDTNQTYDDTQIGAFENGKEFSIDLPGAYEENGNIVLNTTFNPKFKSVSGLLNDLNIDLEDLRNSSGQDFKFKIYY